MSGKKLYKKYLGLSIVAANLQCIDNRFCGCSIQYLYCSQLPSSTFIQFLTKQTVP